MLIVDAHEDLALNVLADGRDYLLSAHAIRAAEAAEGPPGFNGICMLGLPEWLHASVAVIFATIQTIPCAEGRLGEPSYTNVEAAHQQALAQLSIYQRWAATHPRIALIERREHLAAVLASWEPTTDAADRRQVGLVLLMENADPIRQPSEVGFWHAQGLRLVGPGWHANRYTGSTLDPGPLTNLGRALLDEMQHFNMILDLSHMADEACHEALERYAGTVVATHSNPRRMVPLPRSLPDETVSGIIAHDGVVGIMPLNWALDPAWRAKTKTKADIHVDAVVNAIDIVCQLAGDALHVGIGSDFDGGQGAEAAPAEIDTVADLPKITEALARRGYDDAAVAAIMGGNWLRVVRWCLPET